MKHHAYQNVRSLSAWKGFLICALICTIAAVSFAGAGSPQAAFADSTSSSTAAETNETSTSSYEVNLSSEGERANVEGTNVAASDFSRANKGTNRAIDGVYRGYTYIQPQESMLVLVDVGSFIMVYVPEDQLSALGLTVDNEDDCNLLRSLLQALDDNAAGGNQHINPSLPWYFTTEEVISQDGVAFSFNQPANDRFYTFVIGTDGSDLSGNSTADGVVLNHAAFALLTPADGTAITQAPTGLDAVVAFLQGIDFSPLWVTLKTSLCAIVIIFVLGILAAWWSLRLPNRWQSVVDAIFTIPMVLPPTVCGFLLLLALGSNSPIGRWFDSIGFPLIFSWPATVIAAVVVAFPLMYRSARGAFENLNQDMLDAARTLGWHEGKIFLRLMLPLAWSSIAAGTMLAFARALGEFGATLFLAGNYVGITRTIPIAIYFEWMGGHTDVALFWTVVVILLSFLVIFAINVWSKHTTRYRRKEVPHESKR